RIVEPVLPACVELFFDGLRKPPQCDAARGVEDLRATMCRYGKDRTRLGEVVGAWEPPLQGRGPEAPELALGVPPLRAVDLTEAATQYSELQQAIHIDGMLGHLPPPEEHRTSRRRPLP